MSKPKRYSRRRVLDTLNIMANKSLDDAVEMILRTAYVRIAALPEDSGALTSGELLLAATNKIAAIKAVRERLRASGYRVGLLEAKTMVENALAAQNGQPKGNLQNQPAPGRRSKKRGPGQRPKGKKSLKRQHRKEG